MGTYGPIALGAEIGHRCGMEKEAVGLLVAFVTTIVFMTVLELMRRRGIDPVARLADVVMPPMMMAPTAPPMTNGASSGASSAELAS